MTGEFYGSSGVFIVQTFPVGAGYVKEDAAYSEADARAIVKAQQSAIGYTVVIDGKERSYEAKSCCIWEIQAENGGRGPAITAFRRVGDWEFDGLGGARRLTEYGNPFAPTLEKAKQALAQRPPAPGAPEATLG